MKTQLKLYMVKKQNLIPAKWDIERNETICYSFNQLYGQPNYNQNSCPKHNLNIITSNLNI